LVFFGQNDSHDFIGFFSQNRAETKASFTLR